MEAQIEATNQCFPDSDWESSENTTARIVTWLRIYNTAKESKIKKIIWGRKSSVIGWVYRKMVKKFIKYYFQKLSKIACFNIQSPK